MRTLMHFDGGGKNPGLSACGAVVYDIHGKELAGWGNVIGEGTNNIAEYEGLLLGLRMCHSLGADHVDIRGDSQLVIRQLNGDWKCKDPQLQKRLSQALGMVGQVSHTIAWVPREDNAAADAQVRKALGAPEAKSRTNWKRLAYDLADALSEGLRCEWEYPEPVERAAIKAHAEDALNRYFEAGGK